MHTSLILAAIDFRDPIWQFWVGVASLLLSALAIVVTVVMALRSRQKKLLTYEVVSNSSVINSDNDVGEDLELLLEGHPVNHVRLHVIKVLNAGNTTISPEDYPNQLGFEFTSPPYPHPLILCSIHRTEPENLLPKNLRKSLLSIDTPDQTLMTLKPPLLNPRDALFLKVLLMAKDRKSTTMNVIGQVKDGIIKKYTPPQTRITGKMVVAGVLIAFVLGLLISNSIGLIGAFAQGNCAIGSIQVSGSTSFHKTAQDQANNYMSACPIAHIAVNQSSSGTGLSDLESGSLQIANSELRSHYKDQMDHPVAVIVFALIINKNVNISNLSTAQIRDIYSGAVTNWSQVGGQDLPIKVIGRTSTSGTHAAFVNYILGGNEASLPIGSNIVDRSTEVVSTVADTAGAIGYTDLGDAANGSVTILEIDQHAPTPGLVETGIYPFWAIEHMYTKQNPGALSDTFIQYVIRDMQTGPTFIRLGDMNQIVLESHES